MYHIKISQDQAEYSLSLASYFLVMKPEEEIKRILKNAELDFYDFQKVPNDIKEALWEKKEALDGLFTFPPQTIVLGHTQEHIVMNDDVALLMEDYFRDKSTGSVIPLTTNLTASLIHPGNSGPQTYEIYNRTNDSVTVEIASLLCTTYTLSLTSSMSKRESEKKFFVQKKGKISIG